ncbi:MAG: DUF2267 domain-containing protein [Fibrobacter sp.]|jgi:uncharacterized protein (DUF2267 family)|nr:DUF2267 domain-containing protein [Fibrobacter sp.]
MTWTGLETFDTTVQKADIWLKEIMMELNTDSRRIAYMALRSVLLALRDRLTVDEAADLGSQLPLLIRGIYYDEWVPSRNPIKDRHLDEFLARIQERYNGETDIKAMTKAVFKVLRHRVTEGEIKDVKGMMPDELKELWS